MIKRFLIIRWQHLFILFAGIVIGFFLHSKWPVEGAEAKLVTLSSRGVEHEIMTESANVSQLLSEQGLVEDGSSVWPEPASTITNGMRIIYQAPVAVTVADGGSVYEVLTNERIVGDMLKAQAIALSQADRVAPDMETELAGGMEVKITRVKQQEVTEQELVPFTTKTREDADMLLGQEQVLEKGANGTKNVAYLVTYENGAEVGRTRLKSETVSEPKDKIVAVGTKVVVEAYEYGRASWYAFRGCMCAAHPYYPDGSLLRVTRTDTNRSIIVTVNDWGPDQSVHPERIVDLDSAAFRQLAPLGAGTIAVKVEKLQSK